jgi:multiple sugar transport system permease protein
MKWRKPYALLTPTLSVYALVTVVPLFYLLFLSTQRYGLFNPTSRGFVGLGNYIEVLSSQDFWHAIWVTAVITVSSVFIEFVLGFAIALLLNSNLPGVGIVRATLIYPMVIAPVLVALTWKTAYDPDFGLINYVLSTLGISGLGWISDASTALPSVILVDVWQWTPYMALILISGLKSLPTYFYEAAEIDGASSFQSFRFITIPLLKQVMLIGIIFRTMGVFRAYDLIYGLTQGGPGDATTNGSFYAYKTAFVEGSIGRGSTVAVILVIVIMLVAYWFSSLLEREVTNE